ncbi:hypothetical protein COS83_01605 [archaeon CG07_land_8_20_14_0_80_38_8]|nr:MAG: hypothetical protein COS83_01605 [archaeon CG07_land_8_20_14_0_80_38_8]PIU88164.1 MAG: hypothetical protein COS64_04505 [archaeon CG06_land_8_20_14_3_00_37_11]
MKNNVSFLEILNDYNLDCNNLKSKEIIYEKKESGNEYHRIHESVISISNGKVHYAYNVPFPVKNVTFKEQEILKEVESVLEGIIKKSEKQGVNVSVLPLAVLFMKEGAVEELAEIKRTVNCLGSKTKKLFSKKYGN